MILIRYFQPNGKEMARRLGHGYMQIVCGDMIAQSWNSFNPLHVSELELSADQNTQLRKIEKDQAVGLIASYLPKLQG